MIAFGVFSALLLGGCGCARASTVGADVSPLEPWQYSALTDALEDSSSETRWIAVEWLVRHGQPDRVDRVPARLLEGLKRQLAQASTDKERVAIIEAIGNLGAAGAGFAQDILAQLEDGGAFERLAATTALSRIGNSSAIIAPMVAKLLKADSPYVRAQAAEIFSRMELIDASLVVEIVTGLKDSEDLVRGYSASALANAGDAGASYASHVAQLLDDSDNTSGGFAATALGRMGDAGVRYIPKFFQYLKGGTDFQRLGASTALAELGRTRPWIGVEVAALLSARDQDTRRFAVNTLGLLGEAGAEHAAQVASLLRDPNRKVREVAIDTLVAMGEAGAKFSAELDPFLGGPDIELRSVAANALGEMGKTRPTIAARLGAQLEDAEGYALHHTLRAIGKMGAAGSPFAGEVATHLRSTDLNAHEAAAEALGGMGSAGAKFSSLLIERIPNPVSDVGRATINALGQLGKISDDVAKEVGALLRNGNSWQRKSAMLALQKMGKPGVPYVTDIALYLKGLKGNEQVDAVAALADLAGLAGPVDDPRMLALCLDGFLRFREEAAKLRFVCHLLGPKSSQGRIVMQWVHGAPETIGMQAAGLTRSSALEVLSAINAWWPYISLEDTTGKPITPFLSAEMGKVIQTVANAQAEAFELSDVPLLNDLLESSQSAGLTGTAASLREVRNEIEQFAWLRKISLLVGAHCLAWILLIWAYPYWRPVQAYFFWNRWGRRFLGLGYVSFLITWLPLLRRRMFLPFKASLVQQGALTGYDPGTYYAESDVIEVGRNKSGARQPLAAVLANPQGQIVLEGESGLGKTTALVRLATASPRTTVLLRATECGDGVVAAIQLRLQGRARDEAYLRSLIYAGAVDILIDGLNEALPATRARIVQFVEESFSGNFVLTTQPMDWVPPRTARTFRLQPLNPDQIECFLKQQWSRLRHESSFAEHQYRERVSQYLAGLSRHDASGAQLRVLSNPMEANLVAELLSRGEKPDLARLIEQCYGTMEREFQRRANRPFPYQEFAEQVYAWRLSGSPYFDPARFDAEVGALVEHKLMIVRTQTVPTVEQSREETRWWFRHDKLMEFALLPAFLSKHADRRQKHLADEAFHGVYEFLAIKLLDVEEASLLQAIQDHAADARDSTLLYRYIIARRQREPSQMGATV